MQESTTTKTVHVAALFLIGVLTVYVMNEARIILLPLAWALFIALLILPPVKWLENKKFPRSLAIIVVLVIATTFIIAILYLLTFQVAGLLGEAPQITGKLNQWISNLQNHVEESFGISHELLTQQTASSITDMLNTALRALRNSLFSVFRTLTLISLVPLYIFFMLYYRDLFYEGILQIAKSYQFKANYLINKANRVVQQYLSGLLVVTLILGVLLYIILELLGIKYAFFFAIFLSVFNLIPYIGVIISSIVIVLYTIATKDSLFYPVAVLLSLWIAQLIENYLITPYVVGSRVKVNPIAALIAIFAGAGIWGVSGMILFIPLVGAMKVIFDEIEGLKPIGMMLGDEKKPRRENES